MTLLVVGNHQVINVSEIPWETLNEGVMLVKCVDGGVFDLRHRLTVHTRTHGIPLYIVFALPPVSVVPSELLMGFGLRVSKEVILYDQCITALEVEKEDQVQRDSGGLSEIGSSEQSG
jgi:hypothetical protein